MTRSRRGSIAIFATVCLLTTDVSPALAYLKFGVSINGRDVVVKWNRLPARYFVTDSGIPGVSASDLQGAIGRAFNTWTAVPTASVAYQFAGYTSASPDEDDGQSTLGFLNRPELARVLASTSFTIDQTTGELLEADIFFNSSFSWSTTETPRTGSFDLESIALHEIGHFSGLGHSALGETELIAGGGRRVVAADAIMFPIAFGAGTLNRVLRDDDIAGISDLYPDGAFDSTGSISGHVTKNGQGFVGAHVVAFDLANGSLVANFSLTPQGTFAIAGLSPGPHVVRVEPLDDADVDEFFDESTPVDVNFRVAFFDRIVVVPRGGDSGTIELKVVPK